VVRYPLADSSLACVRSCARCFVLNSQLGDLGEYEARSYADYLQGLEKLAQLRSCGAPAKEVKAAMRALGQYPVRSCWIGWPQQSDILRTLGFEGLHNDDLGIVVRVGRGFQGA
jgi:hypothetical protein